jgi:hypothetical protein
LLQGLPVIRSERADAAQELRRSSPQCDQALILGSPQVESNRSEVLVCDCCLPYTQSPVERDFVRAVMKISNTMDQPELGIRL